MRRDRPIYYAAVAGDILGTYLRWKEGRGDERQTAATYSGQFFDLCARAGRRGEASYPSSERKNLVDAQFSIRSRPSAEIGRGIWFYLQQLRQGAWLFVDILRSGASDIIVMDGVTALFLLTPLAWLGKRVFLSVHTVLWRDSTKLRLLQRTTLQLNGVFIRRYCAGCLVASPAIAAQIRSLAPEADDSVILFNPTYDRKDFARFSPPDSRLRPLRLFYAGRIEVEKGVFDLLQSFRALVLAGREVHLDYCGDGAALSSLREAVVNAGLSDRVDIHGHLSRSAFLDLLDKAHVVVVPTRSGFPEGLNQVVIESVLARRPVVTSKICPAVELVAAAVVEAEVDSVESYTAAIERLIVDYDLYEAKTSRAAALREQFFDPETGWTARAYGLVVGQTLPK